MLENLAPRTRTAPCKVTDTRASLDPEDQKLFDAYLADCQSWTAGELSLALRSQNILLSADTIRRYRTRHGLC